MNRSHREPLTPEERMLADRLARDGAAASPSAALDAAILGAAREAAGAAPVQAQVAVAHRRVSPRRRRWPFAAGIAASLALAVGIAWQLRPMPEAEMRGASEMPAAAPAAAPAPAPEVLRSREVTAPPPAEPAPPSPEPAPPPAEAAAGAPASAPAADEALPAASTRKDTVAAETADRASPVEAMDVQQPVERPTAFGAAMHPATASPPPPASAAAAQAAPVPLRAPPPAPPSPPAPMQAHTESAARRAAPAAPAAARQTRAESQALILESIDVGPDDVDPPASADAPEVRAAWLARVRELLDAGRIGEAKASLAEFHRRHPQAELPPDLRALLD